MKTKTTHTPGPWTVTDGVDDPKKDQCTIEGATNPVCILDETEDYQANARLIAAAPDLLEAAKNLDAAWDDFMEVNERGDNVGDMNGVSVCVRKLRATIAKAEGR